MKAVDKAVGKKKDALVIMLTPSGEEFRQNFAREYAAHKKDVVLISGRYEGVDERVVDVLRDKGIEVRKISIGPYILSGGELPAMIVVDAVARQIPGVLGKSESIEESRVASPEVYTRPESLVYKKKTYRVPAVLLSGNHKDIEEWREKKGIK
mgnify:CR=1 FL=1